MTNENIVIGFDYSMTCPAWCARWANAVHMHAFFNGKVAEDHIKVTSNEYSFYIWIHENVEPAGLQIARFDSLARKVLLPLNRYEHDTTVTYIEGYSMGSKGAVFNIAENTAILKHYLYRVGLTPTEVAPTTVKKFATGKGNAQKEAMYDAFVAKTGLNLKELLTPTRKLGNPVTDLVDAFFIAEYGRAHYNENQKGRSTKVA